MRPAQRTHRPRRWHVAVVAVLLDACGDGQTAREQPEPTPAAETVQAPSNATPIVMNAIFGGCGHVKKGPVCQYLPSTKSLHVWLDVDPRIPATVRIDDAPIDVTPTAVEGGQRFVVKLPKNARRLELRARLDDGPGVFELPLEPAIPEDPRITALWDRKSKVEPSVLRGEIEALLPQLDGEVRRTALTLRAVAAREADLQNDRWYRDYDEAIEAAIAVGLESEAARLAHQAAFFALHYRDDAAACERWLRTAAEHDHDDPERRMAHAYQEALLFRARGDMRAALRALERNELAARKLGQPTRQAAALLEQVRIAGQLGAHTHARELAARAREQEDELSPHNRALLHNSLGWTLVEARSRGLATEDPLPLLMSAYERSAEDAWLRTTVQLNLAYAAILRKDTDEAIRWLDAVDPAELDHGDALWFRLFRARVELLRGKARRAQRELRALLSGLEPHDELELRLLGRVGLGETHEALGRIDEALADYRLAQALLDEQLPRIALASGRGRFVAERDESTRRMVDLHLRRGELELALCVARRSRTRVLRVLERQLRQRAEASPGQLEALDRYRRRRGELETRFDESYSLATIAGQRERRTLQAARLENEHALDELLARLDRSEPKSIACEDLPAPPPGQLDLHYVRLDDGWVTFAHDDHELTAHRLGPLPLDHEPGPVDFDPERLRRLGKTLLGPHTEALARAQRVRVMAAGALVQVPFHALPLVDTGSPRLLDRMPVGYGLDLPGRRAPAVADTNIALLVAPPSNLLHAPAEVEAIGTSLAGSFDTVERLQDADATGQQVRTALLRASLLHYVGHARADGLEGWDSALELARNTTLGVGDIIATRRAPHTVVLNGCETGTVDPQTLAGGMSLAHAFVLAGASTVIATTRTVDDAAAAELMQAFHRALAGGATALEALRSAQRTRPATDATMLHARAWVP